MSAAVPVVYVYAFVPWTRKTLAFPVQDISAEDGAALISDAERI
jgi:hypothetical protein